MKRKLLFLFVALFALILIGCTKPTDNGENPDGGGSEVLTEFEKDFNTISEHLKNEIPYFVNEDIELIEEYSDLNATIEWTSSNEELINFLGNVDPDKAKAEEVTLTYKVTIGENEKEGTINVIVTPYLPDNVGDRFEKQFNKLITRDYEVKTTFFDLFEIDWVTTNAEVFDNDGIYHKPNDDVEFAIKYFVKCKDYTSEEKEFNLTAAGVSDLEKIEEVEKWIKEEVLVDLYITDGVVLPSVYEKYNIPIKWESTNPDVISLDGKITHYVFERYLTLLCTFELGNGTGGTAKFECIVSPLDTSEMTEQEILENFISAIAVKSYSKVSFGYSSCPVLSQTFGSLYFYTNTETEIVDLMIPIGTSNRSQVPMDPQLVVVHDTANYNASAKANALYVQSGYSNTSTGWHFTTGNDGVYQTLPENEAGAHANGSSKTKFELVDTGIKATAKKPQVTIGDDFYIYINNQKTNFILPDTSKKFADDGVMCEIGSNGNYWIPKLWYCSSHGYNANAGGNGSGIGIESAVKSGDDYIKTVRITAKLVAELLIRHELTINRVVQHNTTSGKNCPQAIREANYWYTFKDFVSMEKWAKENLSDYQIAWTSNSEIMDNQGYISKNLNGYDEVSYSVVVSKNGSQVYTNSYTTKLVK